MLKMPFIFVMLSALFFCQSCRKGEVIISSGPASANRSLIENAKTWYAGYELEKKQEYYGLFRELRFNWQAANSFRFQNGYEIVTVPVEECDRPLKYLGKRRLILYPRKDGGGFFPRLLEVYGDEGYQQQYGNRMQTANYSGIIVYWNLLRGFDRGMYFKNSRYVSEIKLTVDTVQSGSRGMNGMNYVGPVTNIWYTWWNYYQQSVINNIIYGSGGGANPCEYTPCDGTANDPLLANYGYNFYDFMSSIDSWDDVISLNNSLAYSDLTTTALRNMYMTLGWHNSMSPVTFNRKVGKAFEETALGFFDMMGNCSPRNTPQRSDRNINSGGLPGKVIPDAISAAIYYTYPGGGLQPTQEFLGGYILTEVKAYAGTLELSSNKWQVLGELEVLSANAGTLNPPANKRPLLFFITTSNTVIGQSIINEANSRGIMVWQSKARHDPANFFSMTFTHPKMLNFTPNPGLDDAPRSVLGTRYISAPQAASVNPAFTDCDDIDPEELQ